MDLSALAAGLDLAIELPDGAGAGSVRISDLTEDSRTVLPGSLFVARAGLLHDGRSYIAAACRDGAAAVLTDRDGADAALRVGVPALVSVDVPLATAQIAERFFGDPSAKLRVAGVTGTNGKSTVAHLAHGLLNAGGIRAGLIGTITIDDGREVAASGMTTLPAIELSRTLATMVEQGCEAAVLEVSSHALAQLRAAGLRFDVGVFTSLASDHLDFHGTQEAYAASKARLFTMLGADGQAIVNADDSAWTRMLSECVASSLRCSLAPGSDAYVAFEPLGIEAISVALRGPFGSFDAVLPAAGAHNAMNLLQAVCVAHALGVPSDRLAGACAHPTLPPGRLERVVVDGLDAPDQPIVFVDFAHTDDALERTLRGLRDAAGDRRLSVVFGCGGDRDQGKRPRMGAVAAAMADRVVLTSDNPRREKPGSIISMIVEGIGDADRDRVDIHADRSKAIESAILSAETGEVVLIAGKGHEREQVLPDGRGGVRTRPFDDAAEARRALSLRAETVGT
ncbi:MAG: UDP-N-acetylmuramoyl-L-alanyl-D-glutamate--2,6-diaminopimelate ligase [Planctomycetota bacterium]